MSQSQDPRPLETLIVEDVDSMRELLRQTFEGMSAFSDGTLLHVSGAARNGAEARWELTRRRPELLLLDEVLPGESSLDLLADFAGQGIFVILLTSLASRTEPLPAGALGRILKPGWKSLAADRTRIQREILAALSKSIIDGRK